MSLPGGAQKTNGGYPPSATFRSPFCGDPQNETPDEAEPHSPTTASGTARLAATGILVHVLSGAEGRHAGTLPSTNMEPH